MTNLLNELSAILYHGLGVLESGPWSYLEIEIWVAYMLLINSIPKFIKILLKLIKM